MGPIWVLYGSYSGLGGPTYLGDKIKGPIFIFVRPKCENRTSYIFLGGPIFF